MQLCKKIYMVKDKAPVFIEWTPYNKQQQQQRNDHTDRLFLHGFRHTPTLC